MCRWSKSYGAFLDTSLVDYYDTLPSEPGEWYLGMDVGRKHDKTALTLLYATSKATYLDNIITLSQCEYSQQVQVVKDLDAKHHFRAGFVDEGGIGSALAEQVTKTISSRIRGLAFTA